MLEPEVDARASSGCHERTRIGNLPMNGFIKMPVFSLKPLFRVNAAATCFYKSEMAQSTSTSQSHPLCQGNPLRPNLGLNASRGSRPATGHRKTNRPQRKWQAAQYEEIQKGKELRVQNWAKRRERLNELSALDPEVLKALDMKECMLEVRSQFWMLCSQFWMLWSHFPHPFPPASFGRFVATSDVSRYPSIYI